MIFSKSVILLTASFAAAQIFEVASVKPAAPYKGGPIHVATTGGPGTGDPARLTFSNATLTMILKTAFDLRDTQKISGPDWLNVDMFDIAATLPADATKDQMRTMLQNLLGERFHMAWHREKQNLPAWVLTTAKGRMRLPAPKDAASNPSHKESSVPGIRSLTCNNCTVGQFVGMLDHPEGRLVFDETGLTGTYDFSLTYEPDYGLCKGCTVGGAGISAPPARPPSNEAPPVLSAALNQQLGLKLEKKQRPVDVIVIDHIDRVPVSN